MAIFYGEIIDSVPVAQGGTGQVTQTAAFDALSPTTTKGDIIANNGTNDVSVAVGTDGFIPIATSNDSAGLNWYDSPRITIQSGRILVPPLSLNSISSFSHLTANMYAVPVYVKKRTTFTGLAFGINTAATNLNVKIAVYVDSAGIPGAMVAGTATTGGPYTVVADTSQTVSFSGAVTLNPGWYWLAIQTDQNQSLKSMATTAATSLLGASSMVVGGPRVEKVNTYASGLPDPFGVATYTEGSGATYLGLVLQ